MTQTFTQAVLKAGRAVKKIGKKVGKVFLQKREGKEGSPGGARAGPTRITQKDSESLNSNSNPPTTHEQVSATRGTQEVESKQAFDGATTVQQQALGQVPSHLSRGAASTTTTAPIDRLLGSAGSRTFAFVVGIDKYQSPRKPRLQGAVNDACQMYQLLQTVFGVPKANIQLLCDEDATRDRIIAGFRSLIGNQAIQRGDAIVIYFAGHGSQASAPADWNAEGGIVETLCPVDEEFQTKGSQIHGIPDRTVAALVDQLFKSKGENITLIFDCCHSGGLARGDGPEQQPRFAPTISDIPADLDNDILEFVPLSRGGVHKKGFSAALSKYVLLAACRPSEQAKEAISNDGTPCGAFSNILFNHLRLSDPATTYLNLAQCAARDLVSYSQHPLCEGDNKNRPLFNGVATRRDNKVFNVIRDDKGIFSVDAGSAHGITSNSLFSICQFDSKSGSYREIGVLGTQTVTVGSSVLKTGASNAFVPPEHCRASIISWGPSDDLLRVFPANIPASSIEKTPQHYPRYNPVTASSNTALTIRSAGPKEITFERGDPISQYTKEVLRPRVNFNPLSTQRVLNEIGDFHYHLVRSNRVRPYPLIDEVKLRLHRVDNSLSSPSRDLFINGMAVVQAEVDFGFTIVNESKLDLYPYLFFFDASDFSIQKWYQPPAYNMAAPLPANKGTPSVVHIGFQDPESSSFYFTIPKGAKSDVGFLKLFVSTCPLDMDNLVQESPFSIVEIAARPNPCSRGGSQRARSVNDMWDTSCYVVNIHR